jgi:hypothetical protein
MTTALDSTGRSRPELRIAAMGLGGLALMALGVIVSLYLDRTTAHAFGYAGMTLVGFAFVQLIPVVAQVKPPVLLLGMTGLAALLVVASRTGMASDGFVTFWLTVLPGVAAIGWIILTIHPIPERYPRITVVCVCLAMSFGWELVYQPFYEVYQYEARGYIQWEQVVADIAGISLAAVIASLVSVNLRSGA